MILDDIAPRPVSLPDPPATDPTPVEPVLGICRCGEPVTGATLGFAVAGRVVCKGCVPGETGESGA